MTKKEFKRLHNFVLEYENLTRSFQLFIITQKDEFVNKPNDSNKPLHKLITDKTILDIPFNQVKKINLWIATKYNVFYF